MRHPKTSAPRPLAAAVALACLTLWSTGAAALALSPVPVGGPLLLSATATAAGASDFAVGSALSPPAAGGSYLYTDAFSQPSSGNVPGTTSGFYDAFVFTISGGTVDSITSTLDLGQFLGITNLQVRLYDLTANTDNVTGAPAGGAIDAWSTPLNFGAGLTGTVDVLPRTTLGPGTYVLQVRGTVSGSAGGAYAGVLNIVPVPLPATLPLLLSGLAALGFGRRVRG
ncbi:MAG: FxDxF family PEP-CTERM protein [Proteobacteria bacterium]|nr:FxDxF family PEP-CTERM protein [Pseudomonadota bacterium]